MKKYKYRPLSKGYKKLTYKDALYQFILDHSTPVAGGHHIQFYIKNKADFFARVQARYLGIERTIDVDSEWREVQVKDNELTKLHEAKKVWWKKFLLDLIEVE